MLYFQHGHARAWHEGDLVSLQVDLSRVLPFCEVEQIGRVVSFLQSARAPDPLSVPIALLYPTRPFTVPELYLLVPELLTAGLKNKIGEWTLAFKGFRPAGQLPGADEAGGPILVPREGECPAINVALTSWSTSDESWTAAVTQLPDPDNRERYKRLNRMLNEVLRARERVDYLVLPELAVPPRWFFRFSNKLATRGISLIAGVEYIHHENSNLVANQVWCSLVSSFLGFPSVVLYRQGKVRPALEEEKSLWATAGKHLAPPSGPDSKPVLRHGSFHFGVLICSELTNLENRGNFRGKVDAIFVPEWNPDIETFSALVESSALDVHAYVIQCNNRRFGDSRIRSPAKDSWRRDVVRVKGGREDYFVVGELDVFGLRKFQSANRSPGEPFKPVPDGFVIDDTRRRLP